MYLASGYQWGCDASTGEAGLRAHEYKTLRLERRPFQFRKKLSQFHALEML